MTYTDKLEKKLFLVERQKEELKEMGASESFVIVKENSKLRDKIENLKIERFQLMDKFKKAKFKFRKLTITHISQLRVKPFTLVDLFKDTKILNTITSYLTPYPYFKISSTCREILDLSQRGTVMKFFETREGEDRIRDS